MTTMTLEDVNLADPGNFVASVPHQMFDVLVTAEGHEETPVGDYTIRPPAGL